jgi:hypothetical protein
MRLHIELDDDLVAQIDELSGPRGRAAFVRSRVQFAGSSAGLTSKPQPAPLIIRVTTGMPILQRGCGGGAAILWSSIGPLASETVVIQDPSDRHSRAIGQVQV